VRAKRAARAKRLPDQAFAAEKQPFSLLIFGPAKGRFNIVSGGEFPANWLYCQSFSGRFVARY
jgi:hypothetical protein